MTKTIIREVCSSDLKEVVNKLIPDSIGKDIEKNCQGIYSLHDVFVRKVKILKKPKFEIGKLLGLHGKGGEATGGDGPHRIDRPANYETPSLIESEMQILTYHGFQ